MTSPHQLPALDCHAHIAPDVTPRQLDLLGDTTVFAVTRDLQEAEVVTGRQDGKLLWGIGTHPAVPAAVASYDPDRFRALIPDFAFVGEVGLDRRTSVDNGRRVFADILAACTDQPVLISVHSTGRIPAVLDEIELRNHPGMILHWFTGKSHDLTRALQMGLYFSVNDAMDDTLIQAIPRDRVLPETDYPARKVSAQRPGHVEPLEERLSRLWQQGVQDVRYRLWHNLKKLSIDSGAIETLPDDIANIILAT
ncbi:MAG: TatD DNase family protein [Mycobacterium sp.]|nr:TatD DNase family protein [Mycobacterium sp.]